MEEEWQFFRAGVGWLVQSTTRPPQDYTSKARRRLISLVTVGLSRNALNLNDTTRPVSESHVVTSDGGEERTGLLLS